NESCSAAFSTMIRDQWCAKTSPNRGHRTASCSSACGGAGDRIRIGLVPSRTRSGEGGIGQARSPREDMSQGHHPISSSMQRGNEHETDTEDARIGPNVRPLKQDVVGDVGRVLWILTGSIGMVLLIACANVAKLLFVRVEERRQELALRAALGAGWGRIVGELMLESVLLGLLGGAVGLGWRTPLCACCECW